MTTPKFTLAADASIAGISADAFSNITLDTALQTKALNQMERELKQMESAYYRSKKRYFVDNYLEDDWI
jgi:hypothetical protein